MEIKKKKTYGLLRKIVSFLDIFYPFLIIINVIYFSLICLDLIQHSSVFDRFPTYAFMPAYIYALAAIFILDVDSDDLIFSKEPIKYGIHSGYNPYSYKKEWKYHIEYFFNPVGKTLQNLAIRFGLYIFFFYICRILNTISFYKYLNLFYFCIPGAILHLNALTYVIDSYRFLFSVKFYTVVGIWLLIIRLLAVLKFFTFLKKKVKNIVSEEEFYFFMGNPNFAIGGTTNLGKAALAVAGVVGGFGHFTGQEHSEVIRERLRLASSEAIITADSTGFKRNSVEWEKAHQKAFDYRQAFFRNQAPSFAERGYDFFSDFNLNIPKSQNLESSEKFVEKIVEGAIKKK